MKKFRRLFLTFFMVVLTCCVCLFSGCKTSGVYKATQIKFTEGDTTATISVGDKFEGIEFKEDTFILILDENKFSFRYCFERVEDEEKEIRKEVICGEWVEGYEDEIYFIIPEDEEGLIAKKDGNKITVEYDEYTVIFKKA